jgi:CysZ protein
LALREWRGRTNVAIVADQQVVVPKPAKGLTRKGAGFFTGISFLLRGLGMYARSPRLMLLGLIPAVISFAVLVAAFATMLFFVDDVARWVTPFADDWSSDLRNSVRLLAMFGIAAIWGVLSILLFAAFTLVIGQPFYEAISKRVEDGLGGVPGEIDVSFWRTLPRTIVDSVRLALLTGFVGIFIFLMGLIPVIGQIAAFVLTGTLGGWVMALELTSVPFERRGLRLRDRRWWLRQHRSMAIGFGAATVVCFLIPLGAILVMPAAVAGATLLSRRVFGQPD